MSIYIEPTTFRTNQQKLLPSTSITHVSPLERSVHKDMIDMLNETYTSMEVLNNFKTKWLGCDSSVSNARLQNSLSHLHRMYSLNQEASLGELAQAASLSPSRFSHWFSDQIGIPLRSYKKWLRMVNAFTYCQVMSLTDAATKAGFSDQAHFCRTVQNAFGVTPSEIKQLFTSS